MSKQPLFVPKWRSLDDNGDPLSGGKLYTYAANSSTPLATYTTRAGNVSNANPVILDANGEADVWGTPGVDYKLELYDSANVLQWTVDNYPVPAEVAGTFAAGVTATQTTTNGNGVTGTGNGTGNGIAGTGGASSGAGGAFTGGASNGNGVTATGDGTGRGVFATGGDSNGAGVVGVGGATNGNGGEFSGTGTGNAIQVGTGNAKFTASNPASTTAFTNTLTPMNVPKAWALISVSGGTATVVSGFNIASASISGGVCLLNFAQAMANANWAGFGSSNVGVDVVVVQNGYGGLSGSASQAVIGLYTAATGAVINLAVADTSFCVFIFGAQ